ncbi:unnamed protein product [Haemonchus placei]|uniref:CN hydrolase domain-containing protein n=1 Tax=Haemonchus placei TaxID=6290 RepID=A0A0N4VXB8_HAEPC|nr:unnamed protein product [Haemonchus placei]
MFYYGPDGYMGKHRKLMPTALERCVWGNGDGSTMPVFDTPLGKIGGAICWENYMPMYRVTLYDKGIELYLACTVDDRETWLSTMRTIALEGRQVIVCILIFNHCLPYVYEATELHFAKNSFSSFFHCSYKF